MKPAATIQTLSLFPDEVAAHIVPNPLPMQYLGGKGRLADWILGTIQETFGGHESFIDLFAGSGAVSWNAAQSGFAVVANDLQPYSFAVLKSMLICKRDELNRLQARIRSLSDETVLLSGARSSAEQLLQTEDKLFKHASRDWQKYRSFCEHTPLVSDSRSLNELRQRREWNLFIQYYPNTYFGVRQCLTLDAIRELAELLDDNLKYHLLASTISVMTFAVSSTTHLAQYLKPTSKETTENIIRKRSIDIAKEVGKRLEALRQTELPARFARVLNLVHTEALHAVTLDRHTVVYVDPPYFKEHYSRYYHVLDTFLLYDYPDLTFNPRLSRVTVGRYRNVRLTSDFGLRSKAADAFKRLFTQCHDKGAAVALSYASTSLISKEQIIEIANSVGYKVECRHQKLLHSGQGQPRHREVIEYLFLLGY